MTTFPGSPRTQRGAIVGIDKFNPLASIVVFQYNPDSLSRSIAGRQSGEGGGRSEALRLGGAPTETIRMQVEIDATDQLEVGDGLATTVGIYPQLSALEMLLYPKSLQVILNTALTFAGTIEVLPVEAPMTFLIWGLKRIVPVRLTELDITEEAHDVSLNPIRAKVQIGLRVLTYTDLPVTHPSYYVFLAHQVIKETLATINGVNAVGGAVSGSISVDIG